MAERPTDRINLLEAAVREDAAALGIPSERVESALTHQNYFDLIGALIPLKSGEQSDHALMLQGALEGLLRVKAFSYPPAVRQGRVEQVVFGTGGHRGEIGVGLTLPHIYVILTALMNQIERMEAGELKLHFGANSVDEVQQRGFVLGHDNRLLNPDFSFYTAHLLTERGYTARYAGQVASPEMSRVVTINGWAGALNFTPSHNPFRYGGLKFNPADGGLAGGELTEPLAAEANRLLMEINAESWPNYDDLDDIVALQAQKVARVDVHGPYLDALRHHPVVRLDDLVATLKSLNNTDGVRFVVDPVFGGAVPVYQRLQTLLGPEIMHLIHTEQDPYFNGETTEPSDETLVEALDILHQENARYKVAIRNDPDGDRGLVGDDGGAVKMNRFAALVMQYLLDTGHGGEVVATFPTSRFGVDFAGLRGCKVHLTPVGFKNFRPYLINQQAMVAYEESDGITIGGHTLDKDGILAGLLGLRIVLHYGKPLTNLLEEIDAETGDYFYRQINFEVEITAAEVREKLKKLADVQPGTVLGQGDNARTVESINAQDGYLFYFTDGTWIMMRPSGTEPKVRIYAESRRSETETTDLCKLGEDLASQTILGE